MTTRWGLGSALRVVFESGLDLSVQHVHVVFFGTPSAHGDPYPAPPPNFSMREPRLPTVIDASLEFFGRLVVFGGKSNQTKRLWFEDFHIELVELLGQVLTQSNVFSNGASKLFGTFGIQREPQFECPETSSQGDLPVSIIDHTTLLCGIIPEIFGIDRHGVDQVVAVGHPEHIAIKMNRKPFVWIETPRIHMFNALMHCSMLRTQRGSAIHGRVDMEPQMFMFGNAANGLEII